MPSEVSSRSRRRRRSPSEDEEAPMSNWKLGLVIGVIVLCFGMLYPSLFHPILSSFFARPAPPQQQQLPNRPPIHPSMSSPRSRPDMHPGMRMAAAQGETASTSSSKGMFAWMLPLYTVGVVAFLIYTLFKSKKKHRRRRGYSSSESESDEDDVSLRGRDSSLNIGKRKLRGLQERLKQTELAMSKILEQLGNISADAAQSTAVPSATVDKPPADPPEANESEPEQSPQPQPDKDQYLRDLEKALREFKELSKTYNKEERRRRGESVSDDEEEGEEGVDVQAEESEEEEEEEENDSSVEENPEEHRVNDRRHDEKKERVEVRRRTNRT